MLHGEDGEMRPVPEAEPAQDLDTRSRAASLSDSLENPWPYVKEMKGIEEGLSREKREVVARFLKAATEARYRHAGELSRKA